MEVGDRVLVMPALGENMAVPLGEVEIGDSVILYNLKEQTRIAVPTLGLSIGNYAFNTPAFNFAGFNFSLDFNFQLIPLIIDLIVPPSGTYWLNKITNSYTTYTPHFLDNALGVSDGSCTYFGKDGWFIASFDIPTGCYIPSNGIITIYESTSGIGTWTITNIYNYTDAPWVSPLTVANEYYEVWLQLPNKIKIVCRCIHNIGPGNIDAVKLTVP